MSPRLRENCVAAGLALIGIVTVGWLTLYGFAWNDYDTEAAPAFTALVAGHIVTFLRLAPAYGGSLELRAPFALLTNVWGGGSLALYRMVTLPCLLAGAGLGVWIVDGLRTRGAGRMARGVALAVAVVNPVTLPALEVGHPEELLGAVLCAAAVLLALRDRRAWAALALGLAIANKPWAVAAIGPVLIALPNLRSRLVVLGLAGATTALVLAPLVAVHAGDFAAAARGVATQTGAIFQPWQAWWFFGEHGHVVHGLFGNLKPGYRVPPGWLGALAHPLIIAMVVPLTGACAWRRPQARAAALPLLALLMLLRCMLDPWDTAYYALPFLFALLIWETSVRDDPPVISLAASFAAWIVFEWVPTRADADVQSLAFLGLALPAVVLLALSVYAPTALLRRAGRANVRTSTLRGPAIH